jgi:hypothetical protein
MRIFTKRLTAALALLVLAACTRPAAGPSSSRAPRLEVERSEGASNERVRRLFSRAPQPLAPCLPAGGGKLHLRVTSIDGRLHIDLEPGSSLDPRTRECALEALEAVYLEETGSNTGGPAVPPPHFTSDVTLSW